MVSRAQDECAACHGDTKGAVSRDSAGKVTDFSLDHPAFRLTLTDANNPAKPRRVRQGTETSDKLVERSNLKFNHKLHLDPAGVRDPQGKRSAAGMRNARGHRTVLNCDSFTNVKVTDDEWRQYPWNSIARVAIPSRSSPQ
jgi:hypothetical protein